VYCRVYVLAPNQHLPATHTRVSSGPVSASVLATARPIGARFCICGGSRCGPIWGIGSGSTLPPSNNRRRTARQMQHGTRTRGGVGSAPARGRQESLKLPARSGGRDIWTEVRRSWFHVEQGVMGGGRGAGELVQGGRGAELVQGGERRWGAEFAVPGVRLMIMSVSSLKGRGEMENRRCDNKPQVRERKVVEVGQEGAGTRTGVADCRRGGSGTEAERGSGWYGMGVVICRRQEWKADRLFVELGQVGLVGCGQLARRLERGLAE